MVGNAHSQNESVITFGLVHGAFHGAWCWDKLSPLLQSAGHKVVAMDLPVDDPSADFDTYTDVVIEALGNAQNIVLVGHSRAGNVIPRVASRIPIQQLIYLCSGINPAANQSAGSDEPKHMGAGYSDAINKQADGLSVFDKNKAAKFFYQDCEAEIAKWATAQLRPQNRADGAPKLAKQPDVSTEVILCQDDRVTRPEWLRWAAQHYLGTTAIELPGGHSPFLSRPVQLAQKILELVET
jgi:pimeloyl-ACP methyl ester carboxylesterase